MATTIQISNNLQESLRKRKLYDKETYEEIIWDLLEDTMELSEETKNNIEKSREEIRQGKTVSLEKLRQDASR